LKRNLKIFRNILIFVSILALGGAPCFIPVIINRTSRIPWPLYSLSILCISLSATLESLALLFTNIRVKTVFYAIIRCQQRENSHATTMMMMTQNNPADQINYVQLIPIIN
jgi:hypothetical protein